MRQQAGSCAGFVLAGGKSTRMGRDKADLLIQGIPLGLHVCEEVRKAVGNVTLVGGNHHSWGVPVIQDAEQGSGPLGGIVAALRASALRWNLIIACDLPLITAESLRALVRAAEETEKIALVPLYPDGSLEPLCAVYQTAFLPAAETALQKHELALHKLLKSLDIETWPITDKMPFFNANTPQDWLQAGGRIA